jgi:hypothetical protein
MSSRIPGAIANVVSAAGLITGGNGVRKPVILGVGDIKVLVTDEKVNRGTTAGTKDVLASTLYDSSSIVKIGNSPGSTDWTPTSQYVADTATNAVDWSPGPDIGGTTPITVYGTIVAAVPSDSTTTHIVVNNSAALFNTTTNYYAGASVVVTNPDSSNYGQSQTITASVINNTTNLKFTLGVEFTQSLLVGATVLVTLTPDEPGSGQEYYITYYKKLNNFTLTEYTSEADIKKAFGDISLSSGSSNPNKLTIGALLALRNGAQSVIVGQLDYSSWGSKLSPTESEYNASLNTQLEALKQWTNFKYYVVPMIDFVGPTASTSWPTNGQSCITSVWNHCKLLSAPENKGERTCIAGWSRGTTQPTFVALGPAYASSRLILVAPAETRFSDLSSVALNGSIAAAAYAGMRCFPARVSTTITGQALTGVSIETVYTPSQIRDLLGAGIAVLQSTAGVVNIVHDKTTNTATADTEEVSVIEVADYLKRQTRETLFNIYKGAPIDAVLPSAMGGTMAKIFEKEITNINIVSYKDISVVQDTSEPRLMVVNAKVKPIYPLVWIDITMSFYV